MNGFGQTALVDFEFFDNIGGVDLFKPAALVTLLTARFFTCFFARLLFSIRVA